MSTPTIKQPLPGGEPAVPPLEAGDKLDQPIFHQRYEAMPEGTRAELIRGVVHMPSPAKGPHGRFASLVDRWLGQYEDSTPGTATYSNVTNLLGPESEPMPDVCLLIRPDRGGQTTTRDEWIVGAPEFVAEVASSTDAIDLHGKKEDYLRAGVKEYVVIALRQSRVFWFVLQDEAFVEVPPGPDGIYRSQIFPGLWLNPSALLAQDMAGVRAVVAQGLSTPEHADFVTRLAASS